MQKSRRTSRPTAARENGNDQNRQSRFAAKAVTKERGYTMKLHTPVDIFRVEPKGVLWLESSTSVEEARARIQLLGTQDPGEYVLLNQTTGNKLIIKADGANSTSAC